MDIVLENDRAEPIGLLLFDRIRQSLSSPRIRKSSTQQQTDGLFVFGDLMHINKEAESRLSVSRLKEILSFDENTGRFTWLKHFHQRYVGRIAGGIVKGGYRSISIDGRRFPEHRLAWFFVYGRWPEGVIDHIDQDKTNNRIRNLRDCTQNENMQNQWKAHRQNSTGMLGVSRRGRAYISMIQVDGAIYYLGTFGDAQSAHNAYLDAKMRLHSVPSHGGMEAA